MDKPDRPDREAAPQFTFPTFQIIFMVVALVLVGVGTAFAFGTIWPVVEANLFLNGFIFLVFLIGVLATFLQVGQTIRCVNWIEGFANQRVGFDAQPPGLLAPLASMLRSRGARMQLGTASTQSILESVATRIDEGREITRYLVSLLIFLGLLGTFFGLATTVPSLVETIQSLTPKEGETGLDVFARLQTGLEGQLGGMGVAFASSLLGLAGSLVVGLLELFAGHGQNRFYRELEEWLSTITRVSLSSGDVEASGELGGAAVLVEHMAQQMDAMQAMYAQTDATRADMDQRILHLTQVMERLAQRMDVTGSDALERVADGQERLIAQLATTGGGGGGEGIDAESRMRLRSIDVQLLRILEEISAGRQEAVNDLRGDLAGLAKVMRPAAPAKAASKSTSSRAPVPQGQIAARKAPKD